MERIVYFDGVCNVCNASVQFILKRDKYNRFKFAALQGKSGQEILNRLNMKTSAFDTFLLFENGKMYQKSTAALRVIKQLNSFWPLLYVLIIIPPFIRDFFYGLIARNRYRLFGKRESCMIPNPEIRSRFLD
ncbi:MAG: thiol-disulfide oxidoreductase DCC family protein [Flavobacteriales bacterium]|nr:thiol-disulfide oxidoreductase DCC family protein [Flavobacteriales bacterium]